MLLLQLSHMSESDNKECNDWQDGTWRAWVLLMLQLPLSNRCWGAMTIT